MVEKEEMKVNMSEETKECCSRPMIETYEGIGGFPGHEHIHPGRFLYWRCQVCNKTIDEDNDEVLKSKKA